MDALFEPDFRLSDAAQAASISVATLRSYYARAHITILHERGDRDADVPGAPRKVSGATAIAIGIMQALVSMGVHPARAWKASMKFAHYSAGEAPRLPCSLYPAPAVETIMTLPADPAHDVVRIFPITATTLFADIFNSITYGANSLQGCHILALDELVMGIADKLGIHRDLVLQELPHAESGWRD